MKTASLSASLLTLATRGIVACLGLRSSPRRKTTPPPIFLRRENQISNATINEARKIKPEVEKNITMSFPLPFPVVAGKPPLLRFQNASGLVTRTLNWIQARQLGRPNKRRLHVAETVSLGEKRFVAVIQLDGYQYLVGGGAANVALLATLNSAESFQEIFKQTMTIPESQIENSAIVQMREKA